jgi:Flp pilus assembly protein protease CpaA
MLRPDLGTTVISGLHGVAHLLKDKVFHSLAAGVLALHFLKSGRIVTYGLTMGLHSGRHLEGGGNDKKN